MAFLRVFAVTLLAAVLLSGRAELTLLSTAMLLLFVGLRPGRLRLRVARPTLIRPAALLVSLVGARVGRRELLAAAWFGPKGFASVVYGLLVLQSGIARADEIF